MGDNIYWVGDTGISIGPHPNGNSGLAKAVQKLRDEQVDVIVSLQTLSEAKSVGLDKEQQVAEGNDMTFLRFPITDHSTPPFTEETFAFIRRLAELNAAGQRLFIHCYAGIGRSATIAACVLIKRGLDMPDVLQQLAEARGFAVPETQAQFDWISDYSEMRRSER